MSRIHRVFVDTSVIGGCYDEKFAADSRRVFELASSERLVLIVSDVVLAELAPAPAEVRSMMNNVPTAFVELWRVDDEVIGLRDAYMTAGVLSRRWLDDAAHVAAATIARADALLSWNFKHLVRLDKMKAFNQVNLEKGYGILTILSPTELREHETTDDSGV